MVRPLQFGIVGTVPGRVRGDEAAVHAADWAETFLTPAFFEGAPFKSVSLVLLFGPETDLETRFQPRRKDELPISVELDMARLRRLHRPRLENAFRYVIVKALVDVAAKYRLPRQRLDEELARLPVPEL
jgi:hypothetical protein